MPSVQDWDISCSTELCFPQSLHQKWYSCLNSGGKKEAQRKGSKEHWVWVRSAYNSVEPSSRLSSAHIWLYQLLVCASGPGGVPAQTGGLCCCYHFCDGAVFAWCLFLSFAGQKVICWHGGVCFELALLIVLPKDKGMCSFSSWTVKGSGGSSPWAGCPFHSILFLWTADIAPAARCRALYCIMALWVVLKVIKGSDEGS